MKRFCCALLIAALVTPVALAQTYSGELTNDCLTATGDWTEDTKIEWQVVNMTTYWQYTYCFTANRKGLSHIAIELTPPSNDFTPEIYDFEISHDGENWGPGTYEQKLQEADQPSNQGLPEDFYGIKVNCNGNDEPNGLPVLDLDENGDCDFFCFRFKSVQNPMWGDFYARDGIDEELKEFVYVYNNGFTSPDTDPGPVISPSNDSYECHLLVPDFTQIPEPATMSLLILGAAGAIIRRRRAA